MNIGIFAYGRAGCKITDRIKRFEKRTHIHNTEFIMALDTSSNQLNSLQRIDEDHRLVYGKRTFEAKGSSGDLEPAVDASRQTTGNVINMANSVSKDDIDAFVVIGSLGGGTGGGGAPICAKALGEQFSTTPVYGVGILPNKHEPDLYTLNASRSLQSFSRETDNLLLFDNDHLGVSIPEYDPAADDDTPPGDVFGEVNQDIARCLHMLFTADDRNAGKELEETTIKQNELTKVLATGGLSTICYTTETLPRAARPGLIGRIAEFIEYVKYKNAVRAYDTRAVEHETGENELGAAESETVSDSDPLAFGDSDNITVGTGTDTDVESESDDTLFTENREIETSTLPDSPHQTQSTQNGTDVDPNRPSLERDWPHPTKLVPLTLDSTTAMMDIEPAQTARSLFLLIGPEKHLTDEQAVATTDWADKHTASDFPVAKVYPMNNKKVGILTVCSGIGIPERIRELQDEAETIAERILQKQRHKREAKDVDIFGNNQSRVPPSF